MRISRWFLGGRPSLRDRLVKGLQQARDGDPLAAIETISERFPEALEELHALGEPSDLGSRRLASWLAYRAGQMREAADFSREALTLEEDGLTWNLLGRICFWLKDANAPSAFLKAASLEPERFVIPYRVPHDRFVALAEAALAEVPDQFRDRLSNTMIVVDDLPELWAVREGEDPDLLGVYEGATVLEHGLPERIVLYQRNHENISATAHDLEHQVVETMRHEIGHHFGMTEEELPY
jgi:predicted Zn-dependent protease with MMP-like domain